MKTSIPRPRWLLSAMLISSAGVFLAQTPDAAVFKRFDKNGDGKVTSDELTARKVFDRFDLNKDGEITLEEYNRGAGGVGVPSPATANFAAEFAALTVEKFDKALRKLDRDGDGEITREEAPEAPWFARIDLNADGVLDASEIKAVRRRIKQGTAAAGGAPSGPPSISAEDVEKAARSLGVLKPGDLGIGRMIPDLRFTDLAGQTQRLSDFSVKTGVVIAMTSATCPMSKRCLPKLLDLDSELRQAGFALILVNPMGSETRKQIETQLDGKIPATPYVPDPERVIASALGASSTTEVFLLDATRTLIYRGALDDQYGLGYNLESPRHQYLRDALAALAEGRRPALAATPAPGCELELAPPASPTATPLTYHRDVARILQQNCVDCHREGGIGPFALDAFEAVKDRARAIRRVVFEGEMPPWFASAEGDSGQTRWANDCSLSTRDKGELLAWLDSPDRPLGDPADAPLKRSYPSEWSIGQPDLVIPLSRHYEIKADGFMPYQFDVVQTELDSDKWVTAYEILPSERDVVHHVIVKVYERGESARDSEEGVGGYWAAYVPGNGSRIFPEGFARKLPAGAKISFQIHYTPSGKAKRERLRLGLVFARTPPQWEVKTAAVANRKLSIPPNEANHLETWERGVSFDMPVISLLAHMHVRGKSFKFEVTNAEGGTQSLLEIPRYDFNWQLRYDLKTPVVLARGSTLRISAVYDNSASNKANPDPNKLVKWGSQTFDEMMIGYLEYFRPISY